MRTCLSCNASFAEGLVDCPSCGGRRSYLVAGTAPGSAPGAAPDLGKTVNTVSDAKSMDYTWAYIMAPIGGFIAGFRIALRGHADDPIPAALLGAVGCLTAVALLHGYDKLFKRGGY